MQWFNNMKIAGKLALSFGAVLLLAAAMGGFALLSMARMDNASKELSKNWLPSVNAAMQMRIELGEARRWELAHLLSSDAVRMADYEQRDARTLATFRKVQAHYAKLVSSQQEKALYMTIVGLSAQFIEEHTNIIALSRAMKKDEARELTLAKSAALMVQLSERLNELVAINVAGGDQAGAAADDTYFQALLSTCVLLAVSLVVGATVAIILARGVAGTLAQAVGVARRVAAGDLGARIDVRSSDESGQLMQALRDMNSSLHSLVGEVRSGSDAIATTSAQIAAGNQDLSSRTEQQAGSLEETASSMEQLTATVRQNADNARQADVLAKAASQLAQRGGLAVREVVSTMAAINASSRQIAEIISVIDGIAFQTNILALNAAVEAARAGEQGRGFAVVATEVRNLAHRSAAAAKDIKQLIDTSVGQVSVGSTQVQQAGVAMDDIVTGIGRVTDIMGEIGAASREQTLGIEQINEAVTQMDQVTQQNAALVEQAAAAAESMREQARSLSELVATFRLEPQHAGILADAARPAPRITGHALLAAA